MFKTGGDTPFGRAFGHQPPAFQAVPLSWLIDRGFYGLRFWELDRLRRDFSLHVVNLKDFFRSPLDARNAPEIPWFGRTLLTLLLLAWSMHSMATSDSRFSSCGSLAGAFGPLDYYDPGNSARLAAEELNHFNSGVEFLRKRMSGTFGADLDYILRAFPNHPRALGTMIRLGERERTERPRGAGFSVYCYLERAVRFRPNDGYARFLLANYLIRSNDPVAAVEHLNVAGEAAKGNGNLHYNLGLAYFSLRMFESSLFHAHKAYSLGFDLPGLRKKLLAEGMWRDLSPAADTTNSSTGSGMQMHRDEGDQ